MIGSRIRSSTPSTAVRSRNLVVPTSSSLGSGSEDTSPTSSASLLLPTDESSSSSSSLSQLRWSFHRPQRNIRIAIGALLFFVLFFLFMATLDQDGAALDYNLLNGKNLVIVANYFDNEAILPAHSVAMLESIDVLKSVGVNVFMSVYENGSKDGTKKLLNKFKHELQRRHISHRFILDSSKDWGCLWKDIKAQKVLAKPADVDADTFEKELEAEEIRFRIAYMGDIRNRALDVLWNTTSQSKYEFFSNIKDTNTVVLFVNDVVFTVSDVLGLLLTNDLDYDAVCALDFNRVTFYDTWVTRDMNGDAFASFYPYVSEAEGQSSIRAGQPFNVYSCWNGMVALKALPFMNEKLRFRAWKEQEPRSPIGGSELYSTIDCPVSECTLVFKDLWSLGHNHILVNPNVQVTYSVFDWYLYRLVRGILAFIMDWIQDLPPLHVPEMHEPPKSISCEMFRPVSLRPIVTIFIWIVVCYTLYLVGARARRFWSPTSINRKEKH